MPHGLLVMPRSVFDEAQKRGEKYVQETSLDSRKTPVPYAEIHQVPQAVESASVAHAQRERLAEREATTREKESSMAVFLTIELPASEIDETGYLRDIDHLQLPADRVKVLALEADGIWIDARDWSALEAPPPYQRARVQVELTCGPTPLTAKHVVALAKGAQAMLDNFGAVRR